MTIEGYTAQLRKCCNALGAEWFIAEERFLALMPRGIELGVEAVGYASLLTGQTCEPEPPALDQTIFIQFSSGTTGEPRGVELSGQAIEAQLDMLAAHLSIDPEQDVGYMWLPQSHDMGFFGCTLLAWYTGIRGVKSTPERFLESPRNWFDDCATFGATVTAGPPFAVAVATRAERVRSSGDQLQLRLCLVGAEDVRWDVLVDAVEVFGQRGISLETFTPAYGLAEATLAVTVDEVDRAPHVRHVDVVALEHGRLVEVERDAPTARALVSAGRPIGDTKVTTDTSSTEILVASSSLASGYFRDPEATARHFHDGSLLTSDLGFVREGHLYPCGRTDDVLIVGGRNVYAHQVEAAISSDAQIRKGNCALIARHDDPERIAAVVEASSDDSDRRAIARAIQRIAREASGLTVDEVVFMPRGMFPKTPSGKTQRYRCRDAVREAGDSDRVMFRRGRRQSASSRREENK
jgi:fatty-acyl-CoA synthase